MILLGKETLAKLFQKVSNLVTWLWLVLNKQINNKKIQLLLLTSAFSQVAKIVLTSRVTFPTILCRGLGPSCLELVMNMSKTSKRSSLLLFLSSAPLITFPFI